MMTVNMDQSLASLINLQGKTAIVTGGAMGIGLGIVARLAEAGAQVAIADRNGDEAQAAVERLNAKGYSTAAFAVDVADEASVQQMIEQVIAKWGSIDILVNNAGIYPNVTLAQMTSADFDKVIGVNLRGVFLCSKYVSEKMITRGAGGRIINITSIDSLHPSSIGLAHYDATKHGVWGFTKNIALELAPHHIVVNAVAPGGIRTPGGAGNKTAEEIANDPAFAPFLKKIPMARMGEPDDIGRAVLFLASDLSSYMTGTQVVVDGGYLLA